MTPQEVHDHKMRWRQDAWPVRLHSDLDWKGKDWCRKHLERWQWSMTSWTDVYEHTFLFEYQADANAFKDQFGQYANQTK